MDVRQRQVEPRAAAIGRAQDAFVVALELGNAKAASAAYTRDARLLAPSAELFRGRPAIERFWRAGVETGIAEVQLETLELVRRNGLAYEIGRYAHGLRPSDGVPIVDRGAFVRVHEQQPDGSWLWALEMFNPGAPGAHPDRRRSEGGIR
jgi:ketosteroid isomerase-like protein